MGEPIKAGDQVQFNSPCDDGTWDEEVFTVTEVKDGIAYWDDGLWPVSGLRHTHPSWTSVETSTEVTK